MNILCAMVGHQPPVYAAQGWWSPGEEYGRIVPSAVDGTGRHHSEVKGECPRCGLEFTVARVHLPE